MINISAAECLISLKFSTQCDHVTTDVLQTFKVKIRGQGHSVQTSFKRQIIGPFFRNRGR